MPLFRILGLYGSKTASVAFSGFGSALSLGGGGSAGGVTRSNHSVGQALAVLLHEPLATAFLQPCVKLLKLVLCQLVQRYLTDFGDDVPINSPLVAQL